MNNKKIGLFIFRRDLRLYDNLALYELSKNVNIIIPIFILDKNQIEINKQNKQYHSNNVIQFMCNSLIDLNNELIKHNSHLQLFYGNYKKIIHSIFEFLYKYDNITIAFNNDFSNYATERDNYIINLSNKYNYQVITNKNDLSLVDIDSINNGKGYKQFGAFYKKAIKIVVNEPLKLSLKLFNNSINIQTDYNFNIKQIHNFYINNINISQIGGRSNVLKILKHLDNYKDYNNNRDLLSYNTTRISAYLNFGCISIREIYYLLLDKLGKNNLLIKQLYWRDFYLQCFKFLDDAKNYYNHMDKRFDKIKWNNDKNDWNTLINSQTGFLIIDAAMNEMKTTGFMHNRARMIVGIFWTKYLLINPFHPKYGSQVGFSKYLVDAIGSTQNKMNHHWITELDFPGRKYSSKGIPLSGRPMKIGNDQIKKFDKECVYIKKWLPELKDIPNKELYKWNEEIYNKYKIHYQPIFNEKEKYEEWIKACYI